MKDVNGKKVRVGDLIADINGSEGKVVEVNKKYGYILVYFPGYGKDRLDNSDWFEILPKEEGGR